MFGGFNALATAAALAAIWWTGRMQQSELKLQRRELKAQREELQDTRAVFAKQTFEATFFQILQHLSEIVEKSDLESVSRKIYHEAMKSPEKFSLSEFSAGEAQAGRYLRFLYNALKLIQRSELEGKEKIVYGNLIRAQMNDWEVKLVALAGISITSSKEFKELLIDFRMLKHLKDDKLLPLISSLYPAEIFQDRS